MGDDPLTPPSSSFSNYGDDQTYPRGSGGPNDDHSVPYNDGYASDHQHHQRNHYEPTLRLQNQATPGHDSERPRKRQRARDEAEDGTSHGLAKFRKPKPYSSSTTPKVAKTSKAVRRVRRNPHDISNLNTLGQSVFQDGQQSFTRSERPTYTDTNARYTAIKQLFSGGEPVTDVRPDDFQNACKMFGKRVMTPGIDAKDGKRVWNLRGMKESSGLHHHQLLGAARMRKRELGSEAPQGGILADAMGLGKTVMVLANITGDNIHRKRVRHDSQFGPIDSDRGPLLNGDGITLIVVPGAGLKEQWAKEIVKHCDAEAIGKVMQYSRTDQRSTQLPELLDRYRIVITTYTEVMQSWPSEKNMPKEDGDEAEKEEYFKWLEEFEKNIRTLHRIHWHRIVLDEGQHIKTPGSRTSKACRKLHGTFRWAVSGTPVQNSMEEVYSYLDFLRVPNTLDLADFKKEYAEKEGIEKLSQLLSSFLIRRTYKSTILNKPVVELPDSIRRVVGVEMSEHEYRCYKNVEDWAKKYIAKKIKEIKGLDPLKDKLEIDRRWKQILMVILRLRQLVSSPLIGSHFYALFDNAGHLEHVVEECSIYALKIPEIRASADILRKICARAKAQLKRVVQARKDDAVSDDELYKAYFLGMGPYQSVAERKKEKLDKPYSEIEKFSMKKFMKGEGQLFASAKMREVLKQLAKWLRADPTGKIIIFAQFLESLKILGFLCNYYDWQTRSYTGSMTPKSRSKAREQWASDPEIPILLASLKCGGEGLNLIEGNKVIILDLWFNEAAEQQAFGRCYRIGQEKPTELVRIAAVGTVDFRLLQIQKRKNQQIAALMSDTKNSSASWSVRDYMELIGLTEEDFEDVPGEPWFGGNIREPRFPHPDQFQADMTTKEFAEVIDDSEVDQEEDGSEDPNDLSLFVRGNTSSVKHVRFPSSPDLLATGKVAFDSTEDQFLHDTAASDGKQSTHANSVSADDDDKPNDQLDDADFVDVEKFLQDVYEKEAMRHKDTSAASPPEVVDLSVADAGVSGYDNMMSGTDTDLTVRDAAVDSASTPTEQASPRSLSGSAKTTALPLRFASLYHGMSIEPQTGIGQKGAQDKTKMGLDAKTGIQIKDEPDSDVEITASWTKHRSQSQSHGCIDLTVAGDDFEIIDLPKPKIKSEIVDLTEL